MGTLKTVDIPFIANVQIPCGFVVDGTKLDLYFGVDTHCVYQVKRCITTDIEINGETCPVPLDVVSLIGALHYTVSFEGFQPEQGSAVRDQIVSSVQSICVHDAVIEQLCTQGCSKTSDTVYTLTTEKVYNAFKLYTIDTGADPVDLYEGGNPITLTADAQEKLQNPHGCKTIVIAGKITITPSVPTP